jgi:hypothetical protein
MRWPRSNRHGGGGEVVGLREWLCKRVPPHVEDRSTREAIIEAKKTRAELKGLVGQLSEHVDDLRARVRLELRQQNE